LRFLRLFAAKPFWGMISRDKAQKPQKKYQPSLLIEA